MNVYSKFPITIFRSNYEDFAFYSTYIIKKRIDGFTDYGYIQVKFKKGIDDLKDKSKINIISAWLSFYKKGRDTIPFIFINDYELVNDDKKDNNNMFDDNLEISDDDFPF